MLLLVNALWEGNKAMVTPGKAIVICAAGLAVGSYHKLVDAQVTCGDTLEIEAFLKREFNESAMIESDLESGATLLFFASPDMKTGTFIIRRGDGTSCFASEVTNIRPATKPKPPVPTKEI